MRRLVVVLAVSALVAAAVLGGGYLVWRKHRNDLNCSSVTDARTDLRAHPFGDGPTSVLALGDSYSQGTGLKGGARDAWPSLLASQLNATVTVDGMGSTGWTTGGYCGDQADTFGDRLEADAALNTDLVVLQGSVNDALTGDPDGVAKAARVAVRRIGASTPVVLVGPPSAPEADAADLKVIDRALAGVARDQDRVYVSLLAEGIPILPDGIHPTAAGQQQIARLVAAATKPLDVAS